MIKAILLAAGQSQRLGTENKLIKKFKDKYLINHALSSLVKSKINKIIIVLGYQSKKLKKITIKNKKITYVINKKFKLGKFCHIGARGVAKNIIDVAVFRIWDVPGDLRKFHPSCRVHELAAVGTTGCTG